MGMMTKEDVALYYDVDSGFVQTPGKFECEPWWVVALWNAGLDGCADREAEWHGMPGYCFKLDAEIAAMLTVPPYTGSDMIYICVWEKSDGFVVHSKESESSLSKMMED